MSDYCCQCCCFFVIWSCSILWLRYQGSHTHPHIHQYLHTPLPPCHALKSVLSNRIQNSFFNHCSYTVIILEQWLKTPNFRYNDIIKVKFHCTEHTKNQMLHLANSFICQSFFDAQTIFINEIHQFSPFFFHMFFCWTEKQGELTFVNWPWMLLVRSARFSSGKIWIQCCTSQFVWKTKQI